MTAGAPWWAAFVPSLISLIGIPLAAVLAWVFQNKLHRDQQRREDDIRREQQQREDALRREQQEREDRLRAEDLRREDKFC
jgi:flagellar biosynthesis/type III secretory pathway M-ring protein FliF/YscJ